MAWMDQDQALWRPPARLGRDGADGEARGCGRGTTRLGCRGDRGHARVRNGERRAVRRPRHGRALLPAPRSPQPRSLQELFEKYPKICDPAIRRGHLNAYRSGLGFADTVAILSRDYRIVGPTDGENPESLRRLEARIADLDLAIKAFNDDVETRLLYPLQQSNDLLALWRTWKRMPPLRAMLTWHRSRNPQADQGMGNTHRGHRGLIAR